mgnify:CR=1 FL=1
MKKVVTFIACLITGSCYADELSIIGHGVAKHVVNHNYNEIPYGVALRYQKDDFGIQAGTYYNSFRNQSYYLGVDWIPYQQNITGCINIEAGPYYGIVTGYKYAVTPVIGLHTAVRCNDVFVRARVMPDPFYGSKGVGSIEIGYVVKKF